MRIIFHFSSDAPMNAEDLARYTHKRYEFHAANEGWRTQQSCRNKSFDDLPEKNKRVMIAVAQDILNYVRSFAVTGDITLGP